MKAGLWVVEKVVEKVEKRVVWLVDTLERMMVELWELLMAVR